jgi:hypothetical protein
MTVAAWTKISGCFEHRCNVVHLQPGDLNATVFRPPALIVLKTQ